MKFILVQVYINEAGVRTERIMTAVAGTGANNPASHDSAVLLSLRDADSLVRILNEGSAVDFEQEPEYHYWKVEAIGYELQNGETE